MDTGFAKPTVLVVDDDPGIRGVLSGILETEYRTKVASNGESALRIASSHPLPDLILLDVMMPGIDGYEVCKTLKSNPITKGIPVIFVTGLGGPSDEARGFGVGAVDYITKPASAPIVLARAKTHLTLYAQNRVLEEKVRERTQELVRTRDTTIRSLAILAETRDNETGGHIIRTQNYVRILAEHLMEYPRFRDYLDEEMVEQLYKSAPLHDIGKVGVPDSILLRAGRLSDEEFEEMQRHTLYGRDAIAQAEQSLGDGQTLSFLNIARELTYSHHEKWDGSGYPEGLAGDAIPLSGRLMAVADAYDALISKRPYKPPFSHKRAVRIITQGDERLSPRHFDPDILTAFVATEQQFLKTALEFADFYEERKILIQG